MDDKKDNNLLNYVKNYHVPKKEPKYEDRHVVVPLPSNKLKKNKKENKDNKENKKNHPKLKRVSDIKANNKDKKTDKKVDKKEDKKEPKKNKDKKNKDKSMDEQIKDLEESNKYLQEQINRRENNINKYRKKYEDQLNIIKSLELIISEQKKQPKNTDNKSKTDSNNKHINDIDFINDILAKDIESNENLDNLENDDISFDENFEEDFAIKAVDQQIMDELYPNPDAMSYEQLLQLEDNMGNVNKGLTKNQFDKLPDVEYDKDKYSENYQCIICMEEFEKNEIVKLLPCEHIFHKNCIKQWLLKQKTCPFCKAEIG